MSFLPSRQTVSYYYIYIIIILAPGRCMHLTALLISLMLTTVNEETTCTATDHKRATYLKGERTSELHQHATHLKHKENISNQ